MISGAGRGAMGYVVGNNGGKKVLQQVARRCFMDDDSVAGKQASKQTEFTLS